MSFENDVKDAKEMKRKDKKVDMVKTISHQTINESLVVEQDENVANKNLNNTAFIPKRKLFYKINNDEMIDSLYDRKTYQVYK